MGIHFLSLNKDISIISSGDGNGVGDRFLSDPFIYGDETELYWTRLLGDLNRTRPVLVILSDNWTQFFPADAPIFPWLKENYSVWDTPLGWPHYRLLVRHGTELDPKPERPQPSLHS